MKFNLSFFLWADILPNFGKKSSSYHGNKEAYSSETEEEPEMQDRYGNTPGFQDASPIRIDTFGLNSINRYD